MVHGGGGTIRLADPGDALSQVVGWRLLVPCGLCCRLFQLTRELMRLLATERYQEGVALKKDRALFNINQQNHSQHLASHLRSCHSAMPLQLTILV